MAWWTLMTSVLETLRRYLNDLMGSLVNLVWWIKSSFTQGRQTYTGSDDICQYFDDDYNNYDSDWTVVFSNIDDDKSNKELFEQVIEDKLSSDIIIRAQGEDIIITVCKSFNNVSTLSSLTLDTNEVMTIIRSDNVLIAVTQVKLLSKTYKFTCAHATAIMDLETLSEFFNFNSHIISNVKVTSNISFRWIIKRGQMVRWWTYDIDNDKYLYCETQVTKPIVKYVKRNGRPFLTTIGIIVAVTLESNLLCSGSLMTVDDKKLYIVTYRFDIPSTEITLLVAVATMTFEGEIKLNDKLQ